jgi:hypothetical protein
LPLIVRYTRPGGKRLLISSRRDEAGCRAKREAEQRAEGRAHEGAEDDELPDSTDDGDGGTEGSAEIEPDALTSVHPGADDVVAGVAGCGDVELSRCVVGGC